uniref:Uncharacterized protein n=1 Tax=Haptolina brevifila TaxID=156173 RepID=A0A7S2N2P8_9EUKA|mmetsp:Transcript_64979/g.128463  ORF Transcript_64979/g.128463 Transcript_64979/m.128463 type:complete len:104 (+) Transcript_64979:122-433(+)
MGILSMLRNICFGLLVVLVAYGTYRYDGRFTALLLPPFAAIYTDKIQAMVKNLPGAGTIVRNVDSFTNRYGTGTTKLLLVISATMLGLYISNGFTVLKQFGLA